MLRPGDVVILHDPQTAGMLPALRASAGVSVVWRAHIGLDLPNDLAREAWSFLTPYLERGRRVRVFARSVHVGGPRPGKGQHHPAVDRRLLAEEPRDAIHQHHAVLRAAGLAAGAHQRAPGGLRAAGRQRRLVERRAQMVEEEELSLDSPLLAQISRWDALKDPLGVLAAFAEHVHAEQEPHLLLAGPDVTRRRG